MLNLDLCWEALQKRDAEQDGKFYYGVATTGVFCRPSCTSRRPLRKNVRFYENPTDAQQDGLRPCLRCRPLILTGKDPSADRVRELCRFIEAHSDEPVKLDDLAEQAHLSVFHLQRTFKAVVGLTPKQYLDGLRVKKLKQHLKTDRAITDAVYQAGYGSSSRIYEKIDTRLGMTPSEYRDGGRDVPITYASVQTALGLIMLGATARGLCFLQFGDTQAGLLQMLKREYPQARIKPMAKPYHPDFQKWVECVKEYLAGEQPHLDLPLDIRATAFQLKVWNYLQSIPYGHVQSYGEVAAGIGQPAAHRAVARACASNRVTLVIPCHRVIRGTGELGGYRWGLGRKRVLIDNERAALTQRRVMTQQMPMPRQAEAGTKTLYTRSDATKTGSINQFRYSDSAP